MKNIIIIFTFSAGISATKRNVKKTGDRLCPNTTKTEARMAQTLNDLNIDFDYCWKPSGRKRRESGAWINS